HVQAGDGDVDGLGGLDSGFGQGRMQAVSDVMDRAARVQVGGAADGEGLVGFEDGLHGIAGVGDALAGVIVHRDAAFTAGRRGAAAALLFDQLGDGVPSGADDLGRTADGGCDDLLVDHDAAQVLAFDQLLQHDVVGYAAGRFDGLFQCL